SAWSEPKEGRDRSPDVDAADLRHLADAARFLRNTGATSDGQSGTFMLARLQFAMGDVAAAEATLASVDLDAADASRQWLAGLIRWRAGDREGAREAWRGRGLLATLTGRHLVNAAEAVRGREWPKVVAEANTATELDPSVGYGWYLLGMGHYALGE